MSGVQKLHLEDALEDSPQTRSLLALFEQDALLLKRYTENLHRCFQRLLSAQNEISAATYALSTQLKLYEKQNLPLESDESVLMSSLKNFTEHLDEVSSIQQVLAAQLSDSMMFPINKFLQADLDEVTTMCDMFKSASDEHDSSIARFLKHPKKRDDKSRFEVNEDLHVRRKKFHQTAMHHYSTLNALQFKRKTAFIEPLLGYMHAQKAFFGMGHESMVKDELADFLINMNASVQGVHQELRSDTQQTVELFQSLEKQSETSYYGEPMAGTPDEPPNCSRTQKAGYLNLRSKALIGAKWERCFFFIQGGNLMCQHKDQVAGSLILDLNDPGVKAEPLEVDDRRNTFQLMSTVAKKSVVLQAENDHDLQEWVCTVKNLVADSDYARNVANAPTRDTSSTLSLSSALSSRPDSLNTSPIAREQPPSQSTPPSTPNDGVFLPAAPIQFDIITPDGDKELGNSKEGPARRINPFDHTSSETLSSQVTADDDVSHSFVVRFLGTMQVPADRGEPLVHETIRQIMAARAIHNIFKMNESHLVVASNSVRLVDPSNNSVRCQFPLQDISYWAKHPENNRLFAFISRLRSGETDCYSCHVFECNTSGEEICCALSAATKLAFHALMARQSQTQDDSSPQGDVMTCEGSGDSAPLISKDGQFLLLTDPSPPENPPELPLESDA